MDFKNIGPALRLLRNRTGQKQREVAVLAGITPAMLSAYETGKHRPSLDTTERLLNALGCDVADLTEALRMVSTPLLHFSAKAASTSVSLGAESAASFQVAEPRFLGLVRQALESSELTPAEETVLVDLLPGMLGLLRHLSSRTL